MTFIVAVVATVLLSIAVSIWARAALKKQKEKMKTAESINSAEDQPLLPDASVE